MNYAVLDNGEVLQFTSLNDMVPCTIYVTSMHIDVCEIAASLDSTLSGEEKKVYVNLLSKHSKKVSQITALATLHDKRIYNITEIKSDFLSPEFSPIFKGIKINYLGLGSRCFLDNSHQKRLLIKALLHRMYRLLKNRFLKRKEVTIRTWVEISKEMFESDYVEGNVLIYPYYFNLRRHFNYILNTFIGSKNASLMGLPYSLIEALKIFFLSNVPDRAIVRFEIEACRKHSRELESLTSECLKTSDEFEASSIIMCAQLREKGVRVINKSHGINFSCPYIGYSQFYVFNQLQSNYYSYKSKETKYEVKIRKNSGRLDVLESAENFNAIVVLIHAKFKTVGLNFEHVLQTNVFTKVSEVCSQYNIRVVIKTHPSTDNADIEYLDNWPEVQKIRLLSELGLGNPIFVNLNSAAYYDFNNIGPFLFIDDGIVPVEVMFGSSIKKAGINDIGELLPKYFEQNYWARAHKQLI